jgi:hypothetical protein
MNSGVETRADRAGNLIRHEIEAIRVLERPDAPARLEVLGRTGGANGDAIAGFGGRRIEEEEQSRPRTCSRRSSHDRGGKSDYSQSS